MDISRFTTKSREAVSDAQAIAMRRGHQLADVPHLGLALLSPQEGMPRRVRER